MNPLDRPSIRKLVDGHRARGEDPWLIIAGLYAKAEQTDTPQHRGCSWYRCVERGKGADQRCRDDLVRIFQDGQGRQLVDLCDDHYAELDRRLRTLVKKLYEEERLQQNKHRDATAAVYFLLRSDGCIKIGFSSNVERRVRQLVEIHGPLQILRTEQGGRNREAQLHTLFAEARVEGEWFQPVDRLTRYIRTGSKPVGDPARYVSPVAP